MEKYSTVFSELRSKNKQNLKTRSSAYSVTATLGAVTSIAFILMILWDKPRMGLWLAAIAGLLLVAKLIHNKWTKRKTPPTPIDFSTLRNHRILPSLQWVKSIHQGHDAELDRLFKAMDRDLSLASQRKFLGAHLIAGPKGTGKSQLAQLVGEYLFGKKNIIEFDFKTLDQDSFTDRFLEMISLVAHNPHQMILLENIESITPSMLEPFLEILKTNQWKDENGDEAACFSSSMFFIIASLPVHADDFNQSEIVDYRLISFCSEVITWGKLPFPVMAKITALLIHDYWKQHMVKLEFVAPEVIFSILKESHVRAHLGMHPVAQLIRSKSAMALEQAVKEGKQRTGLEMGNGGFFIVHDFNRAKKLGGAA